MTYKNVLLDHDKQGELRTQFGGFNAFPHNWQPCKPAEFWSKFMSYSYEYEDYRQMLPPERNGECAQARLFFYSDGTGLAMVRNYDYKKYEERAPKLFKFALCHHDYSVPVPEKSYMCYTVTRCSKCGREHAVDSSD